MDRTVIEKRTKQFHIDTICLCRQLPRDAAGFETGKQLIRSAGSIGANYRATRRAKSDDDFLYKMEVVLEEADESHYWLEVICATGMITGAEMQRMIQEANELTAIFVAVCKTLKAKEETRRQQKAASRKSKIPNSKSEIY